MGVGSRVRACGLCEMTAKVVSLDLGLFTAFEVV